MLSWPRLAPFLLPLMLLAACQSRPLPEPAPPPPLPQDPPLAAYGPQELAQVLTALVASQRGHDGLALDLMEQVGLQQGSPAVLDLAAHLALWLGEMDRARTLTEAWNQRQPSSARSAMLAAVVSLYLDTEHADAFMERVVHQDQGEQLASMVATTEQLSGEDRERMLSRLDGYVERYPDQAPLWYARALLYRDHEDLDGALAALHQAQRLQPGSYSYQLTEARLRAERGEREQARALLERLISEAPRRTPAQFLLIRLLLEDQLNDDATRRVQALLAQHPDQPDLHYSLALLHAEAGDLDTAGRLFRELLGQGYQSSQMLLHLAQIEEQQGRPDAAIDLYSRVTTGPNALAAQVQAAALDMRAGRTEAAQARLAAAREAFPHRRQDLWLTEAEMLAAEDVSRSVAPLTQALRLDPDSQELRYRLGLALVESGRVDDGLQILEPLAADSPDSAAVLNALGYTLVDQTSRLEEGLSLLQRAHALEPDEPAILDSLGWAWYRLGQPQRALPLLQQAWELFPDPEVAAHLIQVLDALGRRDEARQLLQEQWQAHPGHRHLLPLMEPLGR